MKSGKIDYNKAPAEVLWFNLATALEKLIVQLVAAIDYVRVDAPELLAQAKNVLEMLPTAAARAGRFESLRTGLQNTSLYLRGVVDQLEGRAPREFSTVFAAASIRRLIIGVSLAYSVNVEDVTT